MSLSNAAETDLLKLIFQNVNWANVGDATGLRGSSTPGSFYISLHTADPGEAGDQTTSEATFGAYARVAVARNNTTGWDVSGNTISNHATITFPTCTSGTNTITYFAVGRDSGAGAGEIIVSGALTNQVVVSLGNPVATFAAGALTVTAD